jgi:hypothetical protein
MQRISKLSCCTKAANSIIKNFFWRFNLLSLSLSRTQVKKWLMNYKKLLWSGKKKKVIKELKVENNFRKYLEKHRERLINYCEHQERQLSSIGSGAVESLVKQIVARTNISGRDGMSKEFVKFYRLEPLL